MTAQTLYRLYLKLADAAGHEHILKADFGLLYDLERTKYLTELLAEVETEKVKSRLAPFTKDLPFTAKVIQKAELGERLAIRAVRADFEGWGEVPVAPCSWDEWALIRQNPHKRPTVQEPRYTESDEQLTIRAPKDPLRVWVTIIQKPAVFSYESNQTPTETETSQYEIISRLAAKSDLITENYTRFQLTAADNQRHEINT